MSDSFWNIDAQSALDRALRYPYDLPKKSYLFVSGKCTQLTGSIEEVISGKIPVVAYGSNASPEALDRKYRDFNDLYSDPIPVLFGTIKNFAVVYSAQFSPYGALPATIHPIAGAVTNTYVTFLSAAQLERMHETEDLGLYYSYEKIGEPFFFGDKVLTEFSAYVALGGSLLIDGRPTALTKIDHVTCELKRITQKQAQQHAIHVLGLNKSVENFIVENAMDASLRNDRFAQLSKLAGNIWQHN